MPHVNREKINKKLQNILTVFLLIAGVFVVTKISVAAVGLQVGNSSLNLGAAENLYYGNISVSSATTSNLLLLQTASVNKFVVDYYGNLTTPATITATNFSGSFAGTLNAGNVSAGAFGSNTGGGNYSFPGNVGIGPAVPETIFHLRSSAPNMLLERYSNVGYGPSLTLRQNRLGTASQNNDELGYITFSFLDSTIAEEWGAQIAAGVSNASNGAETGYLDFRTRNLGATNYVMRILGNGNVGIGTTAPGARLDIYEGGSVDNLHLYKTSGGAHLLTMGTNFGGGNTYAIDPFINGVSNGGFSIYDVTNAINRLVIDTSGRVGIGTTGPNVKLDVAGNMFVRGAGTYYNNAGAAELQIGYGLAAPTTAGSVTRLALQPYAHTGGPWNFISRDDASNAWLDIKYGSTAGITLRHDGSVGIGTPTPAYPFDIVGTGVLLHVGDTSYSSGEHLIAKFGPQGTDGSVSVGYQANGTADTYGIVRSQHGVDLGLGAGDSTHIFIKQGGNVGIGTIAPLDKLSIGMGGAAAPAGSDGTGHNNTQTYLSTDNYALANYGIVKSLIATATSTMTAGTNFWGGTKNANIWNGDAGAGNVGIGTTNPESTKLFVYGPGGGSNGYAGITRLVDSNGSSNWSYLGLGPMSDGSGYYMIGRGENISDRELSVHIPNIASNYSNSGAQPRFTIRSTGADLLSFVEASTGNAYFKGNVGIGTASPAAKLEVSSVGAAYPDNPTLLVKDTSNRATLKMHSTASDNAVSDLFTKIGTKWAWSQTVRGDNEGRVMYFIGANDAGDGWNPAGLTMALTRDGKVGIGTMVPNDKLSIGMGGVAAPAGSDGTGHNNTQTYLSTDNYALANYGVVKALLSGSYLPLAGGTMSGDVNFGGRSITNLTNLTVSKITATTIDPLYNINKVNYSTFAPSIAGGVKEEYIGKANIKRENSELKEYEYIIDFSLEEEGSDLWVWRKVVDYSNDNVQVFITPSGKFANVYYLIEGNKLIFRADRAVEISYRLIGNRYDWREWPTRATDQSQTGVLIK